MDQYLCLTVQIIIIQKLLKGEKINLEQSGLSKREWNELMEAFEIKDKIV